MEKTDIKLDELAPYIRNVGVQGSSHWKGKKRRIYDHQWMFCVVGKGYYEANGITYDIEPGTLLLIEPGRPHSLWIDESLPSLIKWIHFDFEYRKDVYDLDTMLKQERGHLFNESFMDESFIRKSYTFEGFIELPTTMVFKDVDTLAALFDHVLEIYRQHSMTWQLSARAEWFRIMEKIVNQLTGGKKTMDTNDLSDIVKDICHYIGNNYHHKITRGHLANYYGYNEDYIGKIFKSEMKQSISAYINELRIERAKNLLSYTDLSIQNISELIGYSDLFYFSKKMKSITGKSPSEWR